MKKALYLWILWTLSLLSTFGRIYESFLARVPKFETTGDADMDALLKSSLKMVEA